VDVENLVDVTLTCQQCGKDFIFPISEQEFFKERGFTQPHHCKACRANRRNQVNFVCSKCTRTLANASAMYCGPCFAEIQQQFDLESKSMTEALDISAAKLRETESSRDQLLESLNLKLNGLEAEKAALLDESNARLNAAESEKRTALQQSDTQLNTVLEEKTKLGGLLQEEKQLTQDLGEQLQAAGTELEKALKYRVALDSLEPASRSLKERLEALEHKQDSLNQSILTLIQSLKQAPPAGLSGALRRIFQPRNDKIRDSGS
jgi:DNA repair exonuclease SbcCD ATPase subunit